MKKVRLNAKEQKIIERFRQKVLGAMHDPHAYALLSMSVGEIADLRDALRKKEGLAALSR